MTFPLNIKFIGFFRYSDFATLLLHRYIAKAQTQTRQMLFKMAKKKSVLMILISNWFSMAQKH